MNLNKSLLNLIEKIKNQGINIEINNFKIKMRVDEINKFNFLKAKPFLYLFINKFEKSFFITVENLPYCLMPDISGHIIHNKEKNIDFLKTQDCYECKYGGDCPGWPRSLKTTEKLSPCAVKDLPEEIALEVTKRCNLDCRLCFSRKQAINIPFAKIKKIINDCVRLGIKTIRFTGGEPLLYKDIEKGLNYAKEKNLYVILNTNATILDKRIKSILKKYVDNILISLQGFDSISEKKFTKIGIDFKEKIKNIIELNYLIPILRAGTIISRTLVDNFYKYHFLIKKLDIKTWELYRPMTKSKDDEFRINRGDLLKIMFYIKKIKKDGQDIKIANPIPFCITPDLNLSSYVLLGGEADDGHRRIIFDTGGFFKPSYSINKKLGKEIEDAWQNSFLKKIRSLSYLPEKCKKCFYLKWCKGGSRYWAKIINKDYFASDPLMNNE
jgi:radical SAM protein with 4Fe4S-binding SPASM domain